MLKVNCINDTKLKADVKDILYTKGMKIDDLAEQTGYSSASMYRYLSVKKAKSKPVAEMLISFFGLNESDYDLTKGEK